MIKRTTRQTLKRYLEDFLEAQLERHRPDTQGSKPGQVQADAATKGRLKPFHTAILPASVVAISSFERSFSTALGKTFEKCAVLLAADVHQSAEREKRLSGKVSQQCMTVIEDCREQVERGAAVDYHSMITKVLSASGAHTTQIRTVTDLFILTRAGQQLYFEIKAPLPNKGQAIEVTERLLKTHAILQMGPPQVQTYYAMAYNPYGTRRQYGHSFAVTHLDMDNQVLLQEEFWDVVMGGTGSFRELLEVYKEVGKEKGPQILKRLGYDF